MAIFRGYVKLHRAPGGRPLPRAALRLFPALLPALLGAAPAGAEKGVTTAWKTRPDGGEDGAEHGGWMAGKSWEWLGKPWETMGVDMGWYGLMEVLKLTEVGYRFSGNSWVFFLWTLVMLRGAGTIGEKAMKCHEENQTMVPVMILIDVDERCWGSLGVPPRSGTITELELATMLLSGFASHFVAVELQFFDEFHPPKLTERET